LPASAFLFVPVMWMKIVLMAVAIGITFYLHSLPTIPPVKEDPESIKIDRSQ
jgi:hypothetical protein